MFAKTRTVPVLASLAMCGLTTALASAAGYVCPCGPVGMTTLKEETKVGGGKLKVYCTNNAAGTGDFIAYFCTAGGKKKHVGSCIFIGGQNDWGVINGPDGQPCFIYWINVDGGADDGRPWDAVVWIHDIKNCKTSSYCLNNTPGTGWEVTGEYACIDEHWYAAHADDPDDVYTREFHLASFGEVYSTDGPAEFTDGISLSIASTNRRGGVRELRFDTGGLNSYEGRAGDRIVLNGVSPAALINVNPAFVVLRDDVAELPADGVIVIDQPVGAARLATPGGPGGDDTVPVVVPIGDRRPAPVGTVLVATRDYAIFDGSPIASINNTSAGPASYRVSGGREAELADLFTATSCGRLTDASFMTSRPAAASGDIAPAAFVVDVNSDRAVDLVDVAAIITMWGTNDEPCDVNENGVVGLEDLVLVIQHWSPAMH